MWTWIKRNPVLALTDVIVVYAGALAELQGRHLVSDATLAWLGFTGAVLVLVLGRVTHAAVTQTAEPPASQTAELGAMLSASDTAAASPAQPAQDGAAGRSAAMP